jgi:NAD(P) transhydrogenase subunit alpha
MVTCGALAIDTSDEIQAGVVITHDGTVVQPAIAALLAAAPVHSAGGTSQ